MAAQQGYMVNGNWVPASQIMQHPDAGYLLQSVDGGWLPILEPITGNFVSSLSSLPSADEPLGNRYGEFGGYDSYDLVRNNPQFTPNKLLFDYDTDRAFLEKVLPKYGKTMEDLYRAQYGDITSGRFYGQSGYIGPVERRAQYAHSLGIDPSAWGLTPALRQQSQSQTAKSYDAQMNAINNDSFGSLGEGLKVAGLVAGGIGMLPGVTSLSSALGSVLPSMPSFATNLPSWAQTAIKSGGLNALKAAVTGENVVDAAVSGAIKGVLGSGTRSLLDTPGSGATGGNIDPFDKTNDTSVDQIKQWGEDYGDVGLDDWIDPRYEPTPYSGSNIIPGVGDAAGQIKSMNPEVPSDSALLRQALGLGASTIKGLVGDNTGSTGSRTISGADSALQTMRNAITTDEGKYPSPIKPYLSPSMISTGQPVQVPALFSGFDPKFLAQMEQRGYAMGGQVEPTEYVPGPEGKYFARHAKRGFAVNGPGTGQSDDIPTMLADGEYVIDSDTVAALGDGSSKAGAAVLDKFREQIRKHKRSAPIDDIPPKAKSPLAYLKEAQKGKKNG